MVKRNAQKEKHRKEASLRKALRKRAERRYPGKKIAWVGGILYFLETGMRVPDIEEVSKSLGHAGGWDSAFPEPQSHKHKRVHR